MGSPVENMLKSLVSFAEREVVELDVPLVAANRATFPGGVEPERMSSPTVVREEDRRARSAQHACLRDGRSVRTAVTRGGSLVPLVHHAKVVGPQPVFARRAAHGHAAAVGAFVAVGALRSRSGRHPLERARWGGGTLSGIGCVVVGAVSGATGVGPTAAGVL